MPKITNIFGDEILDCRGIPQVEIHLELENTEETTFSISYDNFAYLEEIPYRDKHQKRFFGNGVSAILETINTSIKDSLNNHTFLNQKEFDFYLEKITTKTKLPHYIFLSISLAFLKATSKLKKLSIHEYLKGISPTKIPVPMISLINGGPLNDSQIDFEEYLIIPFGFDSLKEALRAASEITHVLRLLFIERIISTNINNNGCFTPNFSDNEEALNIIIEAIENAGYNPYTQVRISINVNAKNFYDKNTDLYYINSRNYTSSELLEYYQFLIESYPIFSFENPVVSNDKQGKEKILKQLKNKVFLLFDEESEDEYFKGHIIKLNHVESFSKLSLFLELKNPYYSFILSNEDCETSETIIADLSVAFCCPFIKIGSLFKDEQIAKYNRLLQIEKESIFSSYQRNHFIFNLLKSNIKKP